MKLYSSKCYLVSNLIKIPSVSILKNSILQYVLKPGYILSQNRTMYSYSESISFLNNLQAELAAIKNKTVTSPNIKSYLPTFIKQLNMTGLEVNDLINLNMIHITGTKGKGSTSTFTENIIRQYGLKTGLYTSPHLMKVTERIRIDGMPLSEDKFTYYFNKVYPIFEHQEKDIHKSFPSYFSLLTLIAFHTFLDEKVDCAIFEVGCGGEYDPTNINPQPIVCGISTIELEHIVLLGDTVEKIAHTKAGIAKQNVPLFVIQQHYPQTIDVIKKRAAITSSPVYICDPLEVSVKDNFKLGIDSRVQYQNAALACHLSSYFLSKFIPELVTKGLKIEEKKSLKLYSKDLPEEFRRALSFAELRGRCEKIQLSHNLKFYIDGAHTEQSIINCLDWFWGNTFNSKDNREMIRVLAINIVGERDRIKVLTPIANCPSKFDQVIFTTNRINAKREKNTSDTFIKDTKSNKSPHGAYFNSLENSKVWVDLMKKTNGCVSNIVLHKFASETLEYIEDLAENNPSKCVHVLATGSLFFVGAMLEMLDMS